MKGEVGFLLLEALLSVVLLLAWGGGMLQWVTQYERRLSQARARMQAAAAGATIRAQLQAHREVDIPYWQRQGFEVSISRIKDGQFPSYTWVKIVITERATNREYMYITGLI
jgi:Tfp pilus assembly protein PilV